MSYAICCNRRGNIMHKYRYSYSSETSELMQSIMKDRKNVITYRRALSIYLRSSCNHSPREISNITGLSVSSVNNIHSLYNKHGERAVYCGNRGGRNNSYQTEAEESMFLERYKSISLSGKIATISSLQADLEKFLSRPVHKSGVYKLLNRNRWRKIRPRPEHPNHDQIAINSFKKTFPHWLEKPI